MSLKWTDTLDIAIELDEKHPDIDPKVLRFTDLMEWVMELDEFDIIFIRQLLVTLRSILASILRILSWINY